MTDKLNYHKYGSHGTGFGNFFTACEGGNSTLQEYLGGDPKWTVVSNPQTGEGITYTIYYDNYPILVIGRRAGGYYYGAICPYSQSIQEVINRDAGQMIMQGWIQGYNSICPNYMVWQQDSRGNLFFHDFDSFMLITQTDNLSSWNGVNANPNDPILFFDKKNKEHFYITRYSPMLISVNHYEYNPIYPLETAYDSACLRTMREHDVSTEEIKYYKITSLHNRESTRVVKLYQFPQDSGNSVLDAEGKSIFVLPYPTTVNQYVTSPWYGQGSKEIYCAYGVDVTGELIN